MIEHETQWAAPSPLWLEALAFDGTDAQRRMREPAILRFAADSFMEDFLKIVETDPDKLRGLVAIRETWRGPADRPEADALLEPSEPASSFARRLTRVRLIAERARSTGSLVAAIRGGDDPRRTAPLKLYQPAHQRFYLVSACLVCGIAGMPDRRLNTARQESAGFVIRRLLPRTIPPLNQDLPPVDPTTWDEYAMVVSPDGAAWQRIDPTPAAREALVPGEERLPLFPISFAEDDGRTRRLFAGLIPVGKREAYMAAKRRAATPPAEPQTGAGPQDPRMLLLWTEVTEPWKRLVETAAAARVRLAATPAAPFDDEPFPDVERAKALETAREQIQVGSWYVLLDFGKMLQRHLPDVVRKLRGEPVTLSAPLSALVAALQGASLSSALRADLRTGTSYGSGAVPTTLAAAIVAILDGSALDPDVASALETKLEQVTAPYERSAPNAASVWAPFLFPLADPGAPADTTIVGPFPSGEPGADPIETAQNGIDRLADLVRAALPPLPEGPAPALPVGMEPMLDPREGWFVVRCAFERPNCGPLEPAILSAPTRPFQMAAFFDPDAPARAIRIAMPVDTSPAGLRKFDKKAAFMISDVLCGQIDRVKGLTLGDLVLSVLPWPFHKELSVPEKGPCKAPSDPSMQIGMICSLSLPIITICALLLLMIIISLLDFIFRWMPFFLICFPIPGLKAKKA